jgi:hypothetical protein
MSPRFRDSWCLVLAPATVGKSGHLFLIPPVLSSNLGVMGTKCGYVNREICEERGKMEEWLKEKQPLLFLLLYEGYIVTFTKVLTICHS